MNIFTKENLTGENQTGKKPNLPLKYLTASTLIGEKVINAAEEKLGDVKDIMIDMVDGKIHYVVVEMGGFLGMGEKYFAIPFDMLQISTEEHAFILDQKKEALEKAIEIMVHQLKAIIGFQESASVAHESGASAKEESSVDAAKVKMMPGRICRNPRRPAGSHACRMNSAITSASTVMP